MTEMFAWLTVLAYLLSLGLYLWFLYGGKEVVGRIATISLFLGLACH